MNDTVLQKIGVTDGKVRYWLKAGLKITYPMQKNKKYYTSEDGYAFVENGDKYVIPLSQKEINSYTDSPELFKTDFLKNLKLYVRFINWLHALRPKTSLLEPTKQFTSLLLILYLFQRGMDHHYYHFDRYLVYQNYPDTPVGFWWNRLKKINERISAKTNVDKNNILLHLLSNDNESKKLKKTLNRKDLLELTTILKNIRIFENIQEVEVEKITDFKTKEDRLFRTAMPIWEGLTNLLKRYPSLLKSNFQNKSIEIIEGHPLVMIRLILSPEGLNFFQTDVLKMFESEIKRWL